MKGQKVVMHIASTFGGLALTGSGSGLVTSSDNAQFDMSDRLGLGEHAHSGGNCTDNLSRLVVPAGDAAENALAECCTSPTAVPTTAARLFQAKETDSKEYSNKLPHVVEFPKNASENAEAECRRALVAAVPNIVAHSFQAEEIDLVLSSIRDNADTMLSGFSASNIDNILHKARTMLKNDNFVETATTRLRDHYQMQETGASSSASSEQEWQVNVETEDQFVQQEVQLYNDISASAAWHEICKDRFCAICQDLLAVPHIISCGHSFCGLCLNDYVNSCTSSDKKVEVLYNCPKCRQPFEKRSMTYERTLDHEIHRIVSEAQSCQEKAYWKYRVDGFKSSQDNTSQYPKWYQTTGFWLAVFAIVVTVFLVLLRARKR